MAARQFARYGFDRANVDAISTEAGCAKGTIYNYFSSKAELFGAVIKRAARRAAERYEVAPEGTSTRDHLTAVVRADLSVMREEEAFSQVLVREALSFRPETYDLIIESLAPFVGKIESILNDGARRGEIRTDSTTRELAIMFVGILSLSYVQHWGGRGDWPSLDEIPELVVSTFLDGAAPRRPRRSPRKRR
jgi:AcrR family transcriptional regulator